SNWELSAARSIAILELLVTRYGVARNRLSVAGFADTEPIGSNDGPQGRARNRRVDVILLEQPPAATPNPAPESNEPDLP
ncbi:MAG TPA: OmpA family protein, partial [Bryobacteraceae bacterium]|nr:OmpA family protein [Bryobacteraceae bacterium]